MSRPRLIPETVEDEIAANDALAEMAALERRIALAAIEAREVCDAAKKTAAGIITPLEGRHKELKDALKQWAKRNKSVLFTEKKSLALTFGVIGFSASSKIIQTRGVTEAQTLGKIKALGFSEAIRVTEEVNREAMEDWTEERLALVGCVWRNADNFICKPTQEKIGDVPRK